MYELSGRKLSFAPLAKGYIEVISFTVTAKNKHNIVTYTTHVLLDELGPANSKSATEKWSEDIISEAILLGKCAFEDDHKQSPPTELSWQASKD